MTTTHKVLLGCGIALVSLMILAFVGGFLFFRYGLSTLTPSMKMPTALSKPGVVQGAGFVTCKEFLGDPGLGSVTDIRLAELNSSPGLELGIAGTDAVVFADTLGKTKSSVTLADKGQHVELIDIENDGVCEFMGRGSWSDSAVLMDHAGKHIWAYGSTTGVDDMAAGDMNGDGRLEFVVGFNGGGGVHLLDTNGKMQWKQPDGNVWHVEITDTDGNGTNEIIHSNAGGHMVVRDGAGSIISNPSPTGYFSGFSLCRWPTKKDRLYALSADGKAVYLLNFNGTQAAKFDAPIDGDLGDARGTPVRLHKAKPAYLAVVVDFDQWNKSVLYIYDGSGKLCYQEVLAESSQAIAALPEGNSGRETLLVGGESRVLQYSAPASN